MAESIRAPMPDTVLILLTLAIIMAVISLDYWILDPVLDAAKKRKHPTQFSLADCFGLLFMVQWPLGMIHWQSVDMARRAVWTLDLVAIIVTGVIWWAGIVVLSRAGVVNPWHRVFFVALVLPVALVSTVISIRLPLLMLDSLSGEGSTMESVPALLLVGVLALTGLYLSGRHTRRMCNARPEDKQ